MRKELDTLRERGGGQQAAQTIFELRRELYKLQAEKKSVELEKEFLEQSAREAQVDSEMFRQLSDKENELYDCKIKLIQKENEIIMLNQRVSGLERQAVTLRTERDKLITISSDLRAQVCVMERQLERKKQDEKVKVYQSVAEELSHSAGLKENKLDQLRAEVEQMRHLVNRFRVDSPKREVTIDEPRKAETQPLDRVAMAQACSIFDEQSYNEAESVTFTRAPEPTATPSAKV